MVNLIPYNRHYVPKIPNYAGAAGGRSFPSAAGFHTTEVFFTDDEGVYFRPTRDMPSIITNDATGVTDLNAYQSEQKSRIVKLTDGRLNTPASSQHMEMHNEWYANVAGSTLIIPVADLAQHQLLGLCYLVQNGACSYDDVNNRPIPTLKRFGDIVDVDHPYPLLVVEQMSLTEATVEISTSCYAGSLMLQAMGLGGWMYEGINPLSILGASGDPGVTGLGFNFDVDKRWPLPNVTGLDGIFDGHCHPIFQRCEQLWRRLLQGNSGLAARTTRTPRGRISIMQAFEEVRRYTMKFLLIVSPRWLSIFMTSLDASRQRSHRFLR